MTTYLGNDIRLRMKLSIPELINHKGNLPIDLDTGQSDLISSSMATSLRSFYTVSSWELGLTRNHLK